MRERSSFDEARSLRIRQSRDALHEIAAERPPVGRARLEQLGSPRREERIERAETVGRRHVGGEVPELGEGGEDPRRRDPTDELDIVEVDEAGAPRAVELPDEEVLRSEVGGVEPGAEERDEGLGDRRDEPVAIGARAHPSGARVDVRLVQVIAGEPASDE